MLVLLMALLASCFRTFASLSEARPYAPACTRPDESAITYRSDGDGLSKVYDDLLACPNITSLDLDFVWTGCVGPSEPWAFDFQPGDRLPALQKLSMYVEARTPLLIDGTSYLSLSSAN